MQARVHLGVVFGLFLVACGSSDAWEPQPASPAPYFDVAPGTYAPGYVSPPGAYNIPVSSGSLFLEGHLSGQLHNVVLADDTTNNTGSFELWENGSGTLQLSIAASGNGGAGMLIVAIQSTELAAALSNGQWASTNSGGIESANSSMVTSCAGPVMGDWPNELPAVGYEMNASEAPEDPETVVVQIKARFPLPAAYSGLESSELFGTIAFPRFLDAE